MPIYSSGRPCIYGRVPICTDGAGWYSDACRWAGVEHVVYDRPLKNLMSVERIVQHVKDRTEAFDDPLPGRRAQAEVEEGVLALTPHVGL